MDIKLLMASGESDNFTALSGPQVNIHNIM